MKKKITLFSIVTLVLLMLAVWAIPVFADDGAGATPTTSERAQKIWKTRIMGHILLIKDEAKLDELLSKGVAEEKITAEQSAKIKEFWTAHHTEFTKKVVRTIVVRRLLRVQDEAKLQEILVKAVADGKIQQAQADKIVQIWQIIHTPAATN